MANRLYYDKNEIRLTTDLEVIRAIDIYYSGKMVAESLFPSDWQILEKNNRIVCLSFGTTNPELLFNYTGNIKILSATLYSISSKEYSAFVVEEISDTWQNNKLSISASLDIWGDLSKSPSRLPRGILGTSIVRNNLTAGSNEFYFKDGLPYEGSYHQHQDGQAMSEAEHSEDSIEIYRKDSNGKIVDLRKGITRRQIIKIAKNLPLKEIPKPVSTRQFKGGISGQEGESATSGGAGGGGSGGGGY